MSDLGGCREKHKRWTAREYLYSKALIIHRYKKKNLTDDFNGGNCPEHKLSYLYLCVRHIMLILSSLATDPSTPLPLSGLAE